MPNNPQHPQPQIAEPGRQRPEEEIRNPGHANPAGDADSDPFASPLDADDPLQPPPL